MMQGGLDLVTPPIGVKPGYCISAKNYEPVAEGYRRRDGIEIFDGHPKPSEATYYVLAFDDGEAEITEGDTVTGATSGATAEVAAVALDSGSYGGGDGAGHVAIYDISGDFEDDEMLQVSASDMVRANGTPVLRGAPTASLHETYQVYVETLRRNDISGVPGQGPILGVHVYDGDVYAWRDRTSYSGPAPDMGMYKSTSGGWVEIPITEFMRFDGGAVEFTVGETVTGGSSGSTADIERVVLVSGTWSGGDAEGYLITTNRSALFTNNETLTDGAGGTADMHNTGGYVRIYGAGKIRALNYNFYGEDDRERMYFASSEGFAHEFDGEFLVPIRTGIDGNEYLPDNDKPTHIGVFNNHLVLGYPGGSVLVSAPGDPLDYLASSGAFEVGVGDTVTGLISAAATSTVVFGRNQIGYLSGTSAADAAYKVYTFDSGAKQDTIAMLDEPVFMDDQGIRTLSSSEAFGDWKKGSLTRMIQPFFDAKRKQGVSPVAGIKIRSKDQYRLFFDNGEAVAIYLGRDKPEPMLLDYTAFSGDVSISCAMSGEDEDGNEVIFAGDSDGNVFQIGAGTSENGDPIYASLRTPWLHMGYPNQDKRFHRLFIDFINGLDDTDIQVNANYNYGDSDIGETDVTDTLPGGIGDFNDVESWDNVIWSSTVLGTVDMHLQAVARNVSALITTECTVNQPHIVSSATVNYSARRRRR